jgi:hypothetical protein
MEPKRPSLLSRMSRGLRSPGAKDVGRSALGATVIALRVITALMEAVDVPFAKGVAGAALKLIELVKVCPRSRASAT